MLNDLAEAIRRWTEKKILKKVIITTPHRLPSHTGPGMLTTMVATVGSGQPWVPHGDKASQPRSSHWLNACMGNVGTLR